MIVFWSRVYRCKRFLIIVKDVQHLIAIAMATDRVHTQRTRSFNFFPGNWLHFRKRNSITFLLIHVFIPIRNCRPRCSCHGLVYVLRHTIFLLVVIGYSAARFRVATSNHYHHEHISSRCNYGLLETMGSSSCTIAERTKYNFNYYFLFAWDRMPCAINWPLAQWINVRNHRIAKS